MKLYNFYRLVRTEDGRVITGDELKAILTAEGFTIPALLPYPKWVLPPRPDSPEALEAGILSWPIYHEVANQNRLHFLDLKAEYFDSFVQFAEVLEADFEIARYVKDGNFKGYKTGLEINKNKTWEWFARNLMQNYQKNPIEFICNDRFQ